MRNDWWQYTATGLAGVLSTIFVGYLAVGRDIPTRAEVEQRVIKSEEDYDKRFKEHTANITGVNDKLFGLQRTQSEMNGKLDTLIDMQRRRVANNE